MISTGKLPGFNYTPFTKEDLVKSMLKHKESGQCHVHNLIFYEHWNMVRYGTEEKNKLQKHLVSRN